MLNKNGERELCYVVKVDDIQPIQGRDKVECAVIGGWTCMVRKGQFNKNDLGIYFEIDSKVDTSKDVFKFTEKYNGKIKTQKFSIKDEDGNKIGQFWSQGLLMSAEDFGWELIHIEGGKSFIARPSKEDKRITSTIDNLYEGDFLTKELGVTYAEVEDNKRKSSSGDKYKKMANRHPKLFQNPIIKKIYKTKLGKKILFVFFGKKKDSKQSFPDWVVKTDEERIQNLIHRISEFQSEEWIATEKRDGSSTTMTLKGHGRKQEYAVCSRNVRMENRKDGAWYDTNIYTEMADKYNIKKVLEDLLTDEYEFVTIQGETFGQGIQKRDYGLKEHVFEVFNVIFGYSDGTTKRLNPIEMKELMDKYNVPTVPIIEEHFHIPSTCQEILNIAGGEASIYGGMREGIVFRNYDATKSFKAVDNEFLAKYH